VAYAPLAENLHKALAEYSDQDQAGKPLGRNIDDAVELTTELVAKIGERLAGYDWKSVLVDRRSRGDTRAFLFVTQACVNYLRDPRTPGNQAGEGDETLAAAYRRPTSSSPRPR